MTKQVAWMGTAVMTTLLALLLLWQFRTAVVFVLISLALAAAVRPLINRWAGRGRVVRLVLILLFLVALGVFILLLVLSAGADIHDFRAYSQQILADDVWRQPEWLRGIWFQQLLDTWLPPPSEFFAALIGEQGQLVLPVLLSFTQGVFTALSSGLIVLFLSLYWSIDQIHFERLWLSLLPPGQRTRVRDIWQTIESDLGAYIRSEIVQSLLTVLLLGLGDWIAIPNLIRLDRCRGIVDTNRRGNPGRDAAPFAGVTNRGAGEPVGGCLHPFHCGCLEDVD